MSRIDNEYTGWEVCSVCGLEIPASNVQHFVTLSEDGSQQVQIYCYDKTLCRQFLDLPQPDDHSKD